jgi:hypothetical protein
MAGGARGTQGGSSTRSAACARFGGGVAEGVAQVAAPTDLGVAVELHTHAVHDGAARARGAGHRRSDGEHLPGVDVGHLALPAELGVGDVLPVRYGFRVPCVVVSAWARRHHLSHTVYDHTSILKLVETK